MRRARFSIRIELPEGGIDNLPFDVMAEIGQGRAPHDTDQAAVLRWLSSEFLSGLEDKLNAELPEGFYCKIENGVALP
jgi:hypothetical protein